MSRINRLPWGLQSLLQSKSLGQNPSELLQEVRPTVEMFPFWSANFLHVEDTAEQAINNDGQWLTFTIPDNEIWLVHNVGLTIRSDTAADSADVGVAARFLQGSSNTNFVYPMWGFPKFTAIGVVLSQLMAHDFGILLPLPPGTIIDWRASNVVSVGNLLAQGVVMYYPVEI